MANFSPGDALVPVGAVKADAQLGAAEALSFWRLLVVLHRVALVRDTTKVRNSSPKCKAKFDNFLYTLSLQRG